MKIHPARMEINHKVLYQKQKTQNQVRLRSAIVTILRFCTGRSRVATVC